MFYQNGLPSFMIPNFNGTCCTDIPTFNIPYGGFNAGNSFPLFNVGAFPVTFGQNMCFGPGLGIPNYTDGTFTPFSHAMLAPNMGQFNPIFGNPKQQVAKQLIALLFLAELMKQLDKAKNNEKINLSRRPNIKSSKEELTHLLKDLEKLQKLLNKKDNVLSLDDDDLLRALTDEEDDVDDNIVKLKLSDKKRTESKGNADKKPKKENINPEKLEKTASKAVSIVDEIKESNGSLFRDDDAESNSIMRLKKLQKTNPKEFARLISDHDFIDKLSADITSGRNPDDVMKYFLQASLKEAQKKNKKIDLAKVEWEYGKTINDYITVKENVDEKHKVDWDEIDFTECHFKQAMHAMADVIQDGKNVDVEKRVKDLIGNIEDTNGYSSRYKGIEQSVITSLDTFNKKCHKDFIKVITDPDYIAEMSKKLTNNNNAYGVMAYITREALKEAQKKNKDLGIKFDRGVFYNSMKVSEKVKDDEKLIFNDDIVEGAQMPGRWYTLGGKTNFDFYEDNFRNTLSTLSDWIND